MQICILTHFPPDELRALSFKSQPGGDIGFVIHVRDNDLVARIKRPPDSKAYETDERSRIHPKSNLARIACVQQVGNALTSSRHSGVHLLALRIAPASLNIALKEMAVDCVKNDLWHLRARRIVKVDEIRLLMKSRKNGTNALNRKRNGCGCKLLLV